MTEFHVEVVRLEGIEKHPNAVSLSVCMVHGGYPVIFRSDDWKEGDLAVYVPVDAVVPDTEEWAFLGGKRRIKARRLRGVFSMGLLAKPPIGADAGDDVASEMGVVRWEEPEDNYVVRGLQGKREPKAPAYPAPNLVFMPSMYDIEPLRKYHKVFEVGEQVVVTEKIHGQNARFVHDGEKLHVGSRSRWVDTTAGSSTWADVAIKYGLYLSLAVYPGLVLFGETYGNNSDMPYGVNRREEGDRLAVFDVWDSNEGRFLSWPELQDFRETLALPGVPILAGGAWGSDVTLESCLAMAEGASTMASHVREGVVVRPISERRVHAGRVILKLHGEGYLTRKEK